MLVFIGDEVIEVLLMDRRIALEDAQISHGRKSPKQIHCPNGVSLPFEAGQVVRFPAETCANCPLQQQCTTSQRGGSVSIDPDEQLFAELRQPQATPAGRAQLRQRVQVEHSKRPGESVAGQ